MTAPGRTRAIVGITGATGAVYAVRLLQRLREQNAETHLVASPAGILNVHHELGLDRKALEALADHAYNPADVGACIASGSFPPTPWWWCRARCARSPRSHMGSPTTSSPAPPTWCSRSAAAWS